MQRQTNRRRRKRIRRRGWVFTCAAMNDRSILLLRSSRRTHSRHKDANAVSSSLIFPRWIICLPALFVLSRLCRLSSSLRLGVSFFVCFFAHALLCKFIISSSSREQHVWRMRSRRARDDRKRRVDGGSADGRRWRRRVWGGCCDGERERARRDGWR